MVLLVAAGAVLAWRLLPEDSVTKVASGEAEAEFRRLISGNPDREKEVEGFPDPGVYRYSVTGGERFDSLLSSTHDYDGIATILVVNRFCGFEEQWSVLQERWSSAVVCPSSKGELRLSRLREYHEFFGTVNDVVYNCRSVTTTATRCSSPQASVSYSTHRIGDEEVKIAKYYFRTVHLRVRTVFSGESNGTGVIDEWRRASDGLLLRKRVKIDAEVSSAGGGRYGESYEMELLSPRPSR